MQKFKQKHVKKQQELAKQNHAMSVDLKRQIQTSERLKVQIK